MCANYQLIISCAHANFSRTKQTSKTALVCAQGHNLCNLEPAQFGPGNMQTKREKTQCMAAYMAKPGLYIGPNFPSMLEGCEIGVKACWRQGNAIWVGNVSEKESGRGCLGKGHC